MSKPALNWKVAGAAGEGIKSTGMLFSKTCLRSGLFTFDYTEYPSLIRGGHNTYQVTAGPTKVYSQERAVDVLAALNQNAVKFHHTELHEGSVVLYDSQDGKFDIGQYPVSGTILDIPLVQLAKDSGGEKVMANNVALGASLYLFGLDLKFLFEVVNDMFGGKGEKVVSLNQKAAQAGYEFTKAKLQPLMTISPSEGEKDNLTLTGNEAASLGAIAGGMKAYVAYPMTPSSSILHTLAEWEEKGNILVKHAEDEIGVINMSLGLSYAGVRAACGTSGGGFAYMTEAVGLAGVAELPLVIFESQRPGPALGMPTWTAQADLLFVINASQDEFPRIVLAPGDVYEAFELSRMAFEWAERYQLPVIVLLDKHLSESAQSTRIDKTSYSYEQVSIDPSPQLDPEVGMYPRYKVTDSGISLRTIPGQPNGLQITNSYETDKFGFASEEASERIEQMDKRFRKLDLVKGETIPQFYQGSDNPQVTLIGWGSTKNALIAGADRLREMGIDAAVFNLSWMWPFPAETVTKVFENSQNPIVIEGNKTNQLAKLIKQETGIDVYHKRTKYDGRPFYPEEIVQYVKEILNL